MEAKASTQTTPEQQAILDQIKRGQVRAIFVDLDGTLIASNLRLEIMSGVLKKFGLRNKVDLPGTAQKAGSFAFAKIWHQLLSDAPSLKEALEQRSIDPNTFGDLVEKQCLKEFCETLDRYIKDPKTYKEEIHNLVAKGTHGLLRGARKAGIPVIACTNAENKDIAKLTKRIAEICAETRFTDIMYNGRLVRTDALKIDTLGQAILENKTTNAAGQVALRGKPYADMLVMAALRVAMFRAAAGEGLLSRHSSSFQKEKPVFLFVGDQMADYDASKALQSVFDKEGVGCTVKFVAITGTGGTEAAVQAREAEWTKLGITHFRTLEPLAETLGEPRAENALQHKKSVRPIQKTQGTRKPAPK